MLFLLKSHHFRTYVLYMISYNNISRPSAIPTSPCPKSGGRDPPNPQDWRSWMLAHTDGGVMGYSLRFLSSFGVVHSYKVWGEGATALNTSWNCRAGLQSTLSWVWTSVSVGLRSSDQYNQQSAATPKGHRWSRVVVIISHIVSCLCRGRSQWRREAGAGRPGWHYLNGWHQEEKLINVVGKMVKK